LGTIRWELLRWRIPGKARREIVANSLTRALKARKIRTGRELGQAVRLILATLDQDPELRASRLAKRNTRAMYSGAAMTVAQAVAQVERDRKAEQTARELLAEIHREREEARRAWQEVRAGVAHNAIHSNWPGGLNAHQEGAGSGNHVFAEPDCDEMPKGGSQGI